MQCERFRCTKPATVRLPEGQVCEPHATLIADALARAVVLDRDANTCQSCGDKDRGCQWAHVLARRVAPFIRHDPDNALALCATCHGDFTRHPARFAEWIDRARPGLRDSLRDRDRRAQYAPVRPGIEATVAELRGMLGWPMAEGGTG